MSCNWESYFENECELEILAWTTYLPAPGQFFLKILIPLNKSIFEKLNKMYNIFYCLRQKLF